MTQLLCLIVFMVHLTAPAAVMAAAQAQAQPGPAETESGAKFDVWEFSVEGNSVLSEYDVQKTVYPFLGPGKSIETVEEARSALEKVYQESGYQTVLVDIPEQDVVGGLVRLRVVEGKVGRLQVTGERYFSAGQIREKVPELAPGKVPNMNVVQTQLAQVASESSDRSVTPVLRPGLEAGLMEAELKVNDELPLHTYAELNGRNSVGTSRLRLIGQVSYDNLWQKQHRISMLYQFSPEVPDQVDVINGSYAMPTTFLGEGMRDGKLIFYGLGISSKSGVATGIGGGLALGNGYILGSRLVKPLEGWQHYSHSITGGVDYKNLNQNIVTTDDLTNTAFERPVHYLPFQLAYMGNVKEQEGLTNFNLEANFNFADMGDNTQEFQNRRNGATPNYVHLNGQVQQRVFLPMDVQMEGRASGQLASQPLINNEQFAGGGMYSVKGYNEVEVLGDSGIQGSFELLSPQLFSHDQVQNLRALAFVDGAQLWINQALPGQPDNYTLASTGIGFRTRFWKHFNGEFEWAKALIATSTTQAGDNRLQFRIAHDY
ncbi:MAG: hypothetical protein RIQ52_1120 [Pseudomonadota bacterium]|jgi:hemolysin activation/secretion protein